VQAWERIKPRIQQLLVAAGEIVPEDIQPRVQNGELSHEAALELSRARARADALAASQSFREQREAQQSQQNLANSLRDTAQEWVNDRTAKDPNFNAKQPLLEREITFLQAREGGSENAGRRQGPTRPKPTSRSTRWGTSLRPLRCPPQGSRSLRSGAGKSLATKGPPKHQRSTSFERERAAEVGDRANGLYR
jgi:hypothetical protein